MTRQESLLVLGLVVAVLVPATPALTQDDAPLEVALAVDTSGSVKRSRAERDRVVRDLVRALPAGTRVGLFAFDTEPRLVLPAGRSREEVIRAAARLPADGRYTALNDVIWDATRSLADAAGPRVVVVVTDGADENSALDATDGVAAAREADVPVVLVGVGRVADRPLRRIAKLTGGAYLPPRTRPAAILERVVGGARTTRAVAAPRAPAPVPPVVATAAPRDVEVALPGPVRSRAPWWTWILLVVLAVGGLVLGVAAMMLRPSARLPVQPPPAPRNASSREAPSSTLATRLEQIAPVERTLVLTMRPLLHAVRGPATGKLFEVSRQRATLLGRAPGNDVVLEDIAVSSQHCRVRPAEEGGFEVIDVGSTNGTFVNDKRVTRQGLAPGDSLKLGETVLQFRLDHTGDA